LNDVVAEGLLASTTQKGPVSLRFLDALRGYLLPDSANQRRITQLREKLGALSRLGQE
jgi:hypothetical protein